MELYTVVVFEGGIGDDPIPPPMFFIANSDKEFVKHCIKWSYAGGCDMDPVESEPDLIESENEEEIYQYRLNVFLQQAIQKKKICGRGTYHNVSWSIRKITAEQAETLKSLGVLTNDWDPYKMAREYR